MEKQEVITHRNLCYQATYTQRQADGTTKKAKVPIHIVCDNSLNIIDYHNGNVIWDDANSRIIYFTVNSPDKVFNSASASMTAGTKPAFPGAMIVVDYGEIQNLRVELNEEAFDAVIGSISMSADQKEYVRQKLFVETDQEYIIKRKKEISYMTQRKKDEEESLKNYDENDEYKRTVEPVAWY